jgi:hypothetical protein
VSSISTPLDRLSTVVWWSPKFEPPPSFGAVSVVVARREGGIELAAGLGKRRDDRSASRCSSRRTSRGERIVHPGVDDLLRVRVRRDVLRAAGGIAAARAVVPVVRVRGLALQAVLERRRPAVAPDRAVGDEVGVAAEAGDRVAVGLAEGRVLDDRLEPVDLERDLVVQGRGRDESRTPSSCRSRSGSEPSRLRRAASGLKFSERSEHAEGHVAGKLRHERLREVVDTAPGLAGARDVRARGKVVRVAQARDARVRFVALVW